MCQLFDIKEQKITPDIVAAHHSRCSEVTVITQSERGCMVISGKEVITIPASPPTDLVDLTGAGDQFAAGFLYGIINDLSITDAATLGTRIASLVISHVGPRPDIHDLKKLI